MYTFFGGYLIAAIGILFIVAGVFAGRAAMKHKLEKERIEKSNEELNENA